MNVVIQHVPGHREELMNRLLAAFPHAMIVVCDGRPMRTFQRSLAEATGHWHLEDDVLLAPDFHDRSQALVADHGHQVIRGFSITDRPGGWMPASSYLWNQCTWIPEGYGPQLAAFAATWRRLDEHPTGFDLVVRDFLVSRRERYWLEAPSLVQHAPVKSLLGPRSRHRQSPTFAARYGLGDR